MLDENGMYAAGPSPTPTPLVAPKRYVPSSALSLPPAPLPGVAATPPSSSVVVTAGASSSVPPASRVSNPSRRDGNGGATASRPTARALFTDPPHRDRRSPSVTSSGGRNRSRGGKGNGPGGGGGRNSGSINPTTPTSVSSAGGGGRGDFETGSVGSHGVASNNGGLGMDIVDDDEADAEEQVISFRNKRSDWLLVVCSAGGILLSSRSYLMVKTKSRFFCVV